MFGLINRKFEVMFPKLLDAMFLAHELERKSHVENFSKLEFKQQLIAILQKYLTKRKEKYDLAKRKSSHGPIQKFQKFISIADLDFFSNKKSDVASFEIYETCIDYIYQINDVTTAQEVLEKLRSLHQLAVAQSSTQSLYIKEVIEALKKEIYLANPSRNSITRDELNKFLIKPTYRMFELFIKLIRARIEAKIQLLKHDDYFRNYMECYREKLSVEKGLEFLRIKIFKSVDDAYTDSLWTYDNPWGGGTPSWSEAKELYLEGLTKIPERNNLEKKQKSLEALLKFYASKLTESEVALAEALVKYEMDQPLNEIDLDLNITVPSIIGQRTNYENGKFVESFKGEKNIHPWRAETVCYFSCSLRSPADISFEFLVKGTLAHDKYTLSTWPQSFTDRLRLLLRVEEWKEINIEIDKHIAAELSAVVPQQLVSDKNKVTNYSRRMGLFGDIASIQLPQFIPPTTSFEFGL